MSRKDTYHELVKSALIKEGWTITHDPYFLESDPKLSIDLGAKRTIAAEKASDCTRSVSDIFTLLTFQKVFHCDNVWFINP